MSEKLQKVLAHAGKGSRRQIEQWITEGRIQVNGRSAKLGDRVELQDRILLDGQAVYIRSQQSSQIKALIYHKPEGEIVSRNDPMGRPTVFENLPSIIDSRWVSIGRLDINTSGLLLFTNNGELANKLMHPSTGLEREYLARIRGRLTQDEINILTRAGVMLDGKRARFESVVAADMGDEGSNHWYRVVIKEGRYREVRRLFESLEHLVSRLKRIRYGSIKLTRDIKLGQSSKMAPQQLEKLIASAGLADEFGERSSHKKMKTSGNRRGGARQDRSKGEIARTESSPDNSSRPSRGGKVSKKMSSKRRAQSVSGGFPVRKKAKKVRKKTKSPRRLRGD